MSGGSYRWNEVARGAGMRSTGRMRTMERTMERAGVPAAFDGAAGRYDLLTKMNPRYRRHLRSSARRLMFNAVCARLIQPAGWIASGHVRGGHASLYRYLCHSVNELDGVHAFEQRLRRAGFTEMRTLPMDGWQRGVVHSFLAMRPKSRCE